MIESSEKMPNKRYRKILLRNTLLAFFTYHFPLLNCYLGRYLDLTNLDYAIINYYYLGLCISNGIFLLIIQMKKTITKRFSDVITYGQLINWVFFATLWFYLIQGIRVTGLIAAIFPLMFSFLFTSKLFSYMLIIVTIVDYLLMAHIGINITGQPGSFRMEVLYVCIFFPTALFVAYMSDQLKQQQIRLQSQKIELETSSQKLQETLSKLNATQDQLIQSEKMAALSELVAGVAHEINTPIGVAMTAASYVEDKNQWAMNLFKTNQMKKSDLEKYFSAMSESNNILRKTLNQSADLVNTFKQVASDFSNEESRKFDLKEIVGTIIGGFAQTIERGGHKITFSCDNNFIINSYPGAFSQIIAHLIMNSLIHGFEEMDNGHISISITTEKDFVVLYYTDDGKGMPQTTLEKMYNPFFTTKRNQCTGLGMHILYNIITQTFKGSINAISSPGNGVSFVIRIPV